MVEGGSFFDADHPRKWVIFARRSTVCRKHGISSPTFYKWKAKYGGLGVSELKRLKELESENTKLKRMYADLALENTALKDVIEKKL